MAEIYPNESIDLLSNEDFGNYIVTTYSGYGLKLIVMYNPEGISGASDISVTCRYDHAEMFPGNYQVVFDINNDPCIKFSGNFTVLSDNLNSFWYELYLIQGFVTEYQKRKDEIIYEGKCYYELHH